MRFAFLLLGAALVLASPAAAQSYLLEKAAVASPPARTETQDTSESDKAEARALIMRVYAQGFCDGMLADKEPKGDTAETRAQHDRWQQAKGACMILVIQRLTAAAKDSGPEI